MNVFACHPDPVIAATWLADQHVVKMVTETAQILSTVLHIQGDLGQGLFKPTHKGHPCVVVANKDNGYFSWTLRHGIALADEYTTRFGRTHASLKVLETVASLRPVIQQKPEMWALAMPKGFDQPDVHSLYRAYLSSKYGAWHERGGRATPRWKRIVSDNPFVEK